MNRDTEIQLDDLKAMREASKLYRPQERNKKEVNDETAPVSSMQIKVDKIPAKG